MKKPNTFIVGSPKCGTTSLHEYIAQHPEAHMSPFIKEPDYFCPDLKVNEDYRPRTLEEYLDLFKDAGDAKIIGESSVWYLFSTQAAKLICEFDPKARIIMMLRNPIDAAYSLHGQLIWSCNEDIMDFEEALAAEKDRKEGRRIPDTATSPSGLIYTEVFSYYEQVKRFLDIFPREQIKIIFFDEFTKQTREVYNQTLEFLGLSPFNASLEVVNAAKPVNLAFNRFMARRPRLRRMIHQVVPDSVQQRLINLMPKISKTVKRDAKIPPALREKLAPRFAEDVEKLSKLVGRDLSRWTNPRQAVKA